MSRTTTSTAGPVRWVAVLSLALLAMLVPPLEAPVGAQEPPPWEDPGPPYERAESTTLGRYDEYDEYLFDNWEGRHVSVTCGRQVLLVVDEAITFPHPEYDQYRHVYMAHRSDPTEVFTAYLGQDFNGAEWGGGQGHPSQTNLSVAPDWAIELAWDQSGYRTVDGEPRTANDAEGAARCAELEATVAAEEAEVAAAYRVYTGPASQGPVASFTAEEGDEPGTWTFTNTSTHSGGQDLTFAWDVAGTPYTSRDVAHTFTEPGAKTVSLTARASDGEEDEATRTVDVPANGLEVGLTLVDDPATGVPPEVAVGRAFDVTVEVGPDGEGVGGLTAVTPAQPGLVVPDWLEVVTAPDLPSDVALADDQRLRATWTLRPTAIGSATLASAWSATDALGAAVASTGELEVAAPGELVVELELDENPLDLAAAKAAAQAGESEPDDVVDVTVRVTNPSEDTTVTGVAIPELELVLPEEDGEPVEVAEVVDGPLLALPASDLGDLGPGETSLPVRWHVRGLAHGTVDLTASTEGTIPAGPVAGEATEQLAVEDVLAIIDLAPRGVATRPDGSQYVVGGREWRLEGTIRNTSPDETVVVRLNPWFQGNASRGQLVSEATTAPTVATEQCPVVPTLVVEPDSTVDVTLPVRASRVLGGEDGLVTFSPRLTIEARDGEVLDAPEELEDTAWDIRRDGSSIQLDPTYAMRVETGRLPVDRDGWERAWFVTDTGLDALSTMLTEVDALALGAVEAVHAFGNDDIEPEQLNTYNQVAQLVHHVTVQMTPAERRAFVAETTESMVRQTAGLVQDDARRAEIRAEVQRVVSEWAATTYQDFREDEYYEGTFDAVAGRIAAFAGENPDVALGVVGFGASTLCRLGARSPRVLSLLARMQALRGEALARWGGTLVGSEFLEPGLEVSYRLARQAFGIDEYTWRVYRDAAEQSEGILMLRRRGLGAIDKLESGAWLKTEAFKSKNVSPIDVTFFDFPEGWLDTVASGMPPSWADVTSRPAWANADEALRRDVRKRWETRLEEMRGNPAKPGTESVWDGLQRMEATSGTEGGGAPFPAESIWKDINVDGDDYATLVKEGLTIPDDPANTRWRPIELERHRVGDREFAKVRVVDDAGVPHDLTGDMDPVAYLEGNGVEVMNIADRNALYDHLADQGVLVHGETQTAERFLQDKFLKAHVYGVPGNEPLLAFMPDGRVVISWYDPRKSTFQAASLAEEGQGFMFHGVTAKLRAELDLPSPFPTIPEPPLRYPVLEPLRWLVGGGQCLLGPVTPPTATCTVELTRDPDGVVARQPAPGVIEVWTPREGWQDYATWVRTAPAPSSWGRAFALAEPVGAVRLALQPQTATRVPSDVGDRELVTVDGVFADLRAGDRVVVDPGGPDEEQRTVTDTAPLRVDRPLGHAHDAGTLVARLPTAGGTVTVVDRLAGSDRIATAIEVSRATFPRADTVVVARAGDYPDALAGAPLAHALGAPILLSATAELRDDVLAEVRRLAPREVVVLGGAAAVGDDVVRALEGDGRTVRRIAGADRFRTAAAIAAEVGSEHGVYVVEGANADPRRGWPDALAVAPVAARQGRPVLLVGRDVLPEATRAALVDTPTATIVGGEAAVSAGVARAIGALAPATRVAGPDRYATAAAVAALLPAASRTLWVATGRSFPDALAAGPAAAAGGDALALVDGQDLDTAMPTIVGLATSGRPGRVHVLGGTAAITEVVARHLADRLGAPPSSSRVP